MSILFAPMGFLWVWPFFLLFASGFLNVFPRNVVAFIENFNDLRCQVKEFTGNNGNLAQEIKGGDYAYLNWLALSRE